MRHLARAASLCRAVGDSPAATCRTTFSAMPLPSQPDDDGNNHALHEESADARQRADTVQSASSDGNSRHVERKRRLNLDSIPMLDTSTTCSASKSSDAFVSSSLQWRDMVAISKAAPLENVLTDGYRRHHSYLRISLTERCNLRCQYCMPEHGVDLTPSKELLSTPEIIRLARIFVGEGVDKIRLTGGEPTVRKDIVPLAAELGALPGLRTLAMTTNGVALTRKLEGLQSAGLTALNISLDTLQPDRFVRFTRRQGQERVLAAIHQAARMAFAVKVNVVLMRGQNDDELVDFVELTRDLPINVRFIEYMPFDDNAWTKDKMYTYKEMKQDIEHRFGPLSRCRDPRGEVAKNYTLEGFAGSVSFVTSMTEHFCADCNRVRLMADGNLKVCLFGASEVSLRDAMRGGASDEDLRAVISVAVKRKKFAHADMDVLAATKNRAMIKIGG